MRHDYKISGMTCGNCSTKVKTLLSEVPGISVIDIDVKSAKAVIEMSGHVSTLMLQDALKQDPRFSISEIHGHDDSNKPVKGWFETYQPVLLVFFYLFGVTILIEWFDGSFSTLAWMNNFMGGFFLVFSFFKMINLKQFAESYSTYDIVAKKWVVWGYVYAFLELFLGLAYLSGFFPAFTNSITFLLMSVSMVGVVNALMNKRKIRCACLGAVFNLPMSTITVVEDGLMIVMSGFMLIFHLT